MAAAIRHRVRVLLAIFMAGLILSGITALPLEVETRFLAYVVAGLSNDGLTPLSVMGWVLRVHEAVVDTGKRYPFLAYGTDWLAFGHFVIATAFIGPLRDPIRYVWVVKFGMFACALVVPFALAMGAVRSIPLWWRLIDCCLGIFGFIPLWLCQRQIAALARTGVIGLECQQQ